MKIKEVFGDLSDLPDFESYKLKLNNLKKIDFSNLSSSEIYHKIYDYFITFPCVFGGLKNAHSMSLNFSELD